MDNIELKEVPGFYGMYSASRCGLIYSSYTKKFLKKYVAPSGYEQVSMKKNKKPKTFRVHRIIALAFFGESSLCVNHKDGNRSNNHAGNLEYCTHKENNDHAIFVLKKRIPMPKLDVEQVLTVITMTNMKSKDLAAYYGVNKTTIRDIRNRKSYKNITSQLSGVDFTWITSRKYKPNTAKSEG